MFRLAVLVSLATVLFSPLPASAEETRSFLCADSGLRKLMLFSEEGEVEWEIEGVYCYDVHLLANGNVLFCDQRKSHSYVKEMTRDREVVFEYKVIGEVFTCQRLENGNTLVCNWLGHGKEGTGWPLFEVTPEKKIVWKFTDTERTKWIAAAQLVE